MDGDKVLKFLYELKNKNELMRLELLGLANVLRNMQNPADPNEVADMVETVVEVGRVKNRWLVKEKSDCSRRS